MILGKNIAITGSHRQGGFKAPVKYGPGDFTIQSGRESDQSFFVSVDEVHIHPRQVGCKTIDVALRDNFCQIPVALIVLCEEDQSIWNRDQGGVFGPFFRRPRGQIKLAGR